jgi:predicted AAA+ superfamily ATPase
MLRVLPPWFENLGKRQVKAPKIYLRDSGILHSLLQIAGMYDLLGHPKLGASWEGFALEQVLTLFDTRDAYFWATHAGAELDLMVLHGGRRYGFEFKYAEAPAPNRSMRIASEDLRLDHLWVIYPGTKSWSAGAGITVQPLRDVDAVVGCLDR